MKVMPASQEIINLLAEAPNVLEFTPSDEAKARGWELVAREKAGLQTDFFCNRNKGSDIGSIRSAEDTVLVRFFNPRMDVWSEHFAFDAFWQIVPITDIGRVTARILAFNAENRILERQALQE